MAPIVCAYGGGTNSTAMLIRMVELKERVDLILFADTGGEKPSTYAIVREFSSWLVARGYPEIITVRHNNKHGEVVTLEERCLSQGMLPSLAYGFKKCSLKFKRSPQDKFVNNWLPAKQAWKDGEKVIKLIGYDAEESHRLKSAPKDDPKYIYRYPLIDWDWCREDCLDAIDDSGITRPGKSACFFCPATKKHEIIRMLNEDPCLLERALKMEQNAMPKLQTVMGLGRSYSWTNLVKADKAQMKLFPPDVVEQDCLCFDGSDDE